MPVERIEQRIYLIRGHKVMLSGDLAILYGVEPRVLIQAVKRNRERFPADFMFQLNQEEFAILKSQIVTSSWGGARRALPYAFTEHGAIMAASVQVVRAFVRLRELLATHKDLAKRLEAVESQLKRHDAKFNKQTKEIKVVLETIYRLMESPEEPKRITGFLPNN